jgi:hypothetical protein
MEIRKMTEIAKTALEIAREGLEAKAKETNASRTGKGTRIKVGSTRGKNPQAVSFEQFDLSNSGTLPTSFSEFAELTGIKEEPTLLSFLIDGYNDAMYSQASDPVAEYINPEWTEEVQSKFRVVVRNYATATGVSIEDAVALIKPGIEASQRKETASV